MSGAAFAFSLTLLPLHPGFFPHNPSARMYCAFIGAGGVGAGGVDQQPPRVDG